MVAPIRSFLTAEDFVTRLSVIEERTKDLLQYWQVHAPHYTDHGKTHCEAVEKNLDEFIPDDIKTGMNEYEIFLLLLGVLLHDIGIMCKTSSEEETQKIRENHHEKSRQYVLNRLKDILTGSERYVVGEICFAHRDLIELEEIERVKTIRHSSLGNMHVRVRFLAGLVRLADTCDVCYTRSSEELTSVARLPDESDFFHALHERVSGIKFDTEEKTIHMDFNVASAREKNICRDYLVDDIQKALNSVRDCLTRNGVIYINVEPKFSITPTLSSELIKPRKITKEKKPKSVSKDLQSEQMLKKALSFYRKKNYKKSLEILEKLKEKLPKSATLWSTIADAQFRSGNLEEARKAHDKRTELDPKNPTYLTNAAVFYGEYLLDIKKSFDLHEKAYQIRPNDSTYRLNYAEALVTIGKAQEGNNISTKYLQVGNEVDKILNASFIVVHSLFFLGKTKEGLKKLGNLVMFFRSSPPSLKKTNAWTYNKIRKYFKESALSKHDKKLLTDTIDLLELKISIEDFDREHKKIFETS